MLWFILALAILGHASANQKCTGNPRRYNGKQCASTTNYHDGHKGACGCGDPNGDSQFGWNRDGFTIAANQFLFDDHNKGWCGGNCGHCIRLTTTGGYVPGQGGPVAEGQSHVFMITNLCPNEWPNLSWCSQTASHRTNQYGYEFHFDLENGANQIRGMGWNNPEVTWEWVNCDEGHRAEYKSPGYGQYSSCQCGH